MIEYDASTRNFICDANNVPFTAYRRKHNENFLVPEMYVHWLYPSEIPKEYIETTDEELLSNSVSVIPEEYQIVGAKWLLKSGRNLGDATGLGKTIQVLLAYEHMRLKGDITHFLVFCPKRAILTWEREFEKHLGRKPDETVMIINYDQVKSEKGLEKIQEFVKKSDKLYVNIDEIHNLAGIASKRFLMLDCLLTGRRNTHITSTTATFIRNKTPSFYAPYRLLRGADITASLFTKEFFNERTCQYCSFYGRGDRGQGRI